METIYECQCIKPKTLELYGTHKITLTQDCAIKSINQDYMPTRKGEGIISRGDPIIEFECCYKIELENIMQNNVKIHRLTSNNIRQEKWLYK